MSQPTVTILHSIPGRIRLSLSWPPQKPDQFPKSILGHPEVEQVEYNPITKSLLVFYAKGKIEVEEILIRVATYLSLEYNFLPVRLVNKLSQNSLGMMDKYAGLTLLAAWGVKLLNLSLPIQRLFLWNGALNTVAAIMSHAWIEAKKKGNYDLEVFSVGYLLNSLFKENLLSSATLTWFTAFGRHIWELAEGSLVLQVCKVEENSQGTPFYSVIIRSESEHNPLLRLGKDLLNSLTKPLPGGLGGTKGIRSSAPCFYKIA